MEQCKKLAAIKPSFFCIFFFMNSPQTKQNRICIINISYHQNLWILINPFCPIRCHYYYTKYINWYMYRNQRYTLLNISEPYIFSLQQRKNNDIEATEKIKAASNINRTFLLAVCLNSIPNTSDKSQTQTAISNCRIHLSDLPNPGVLLSTYTRILLISIIKITVYI